MNSDNQYFFQATNIRVCYEDRLLLEKVELKIALGTCVSIHGPVGCGKTSLLRVLGLLDAPDQGEIQIADHQQCNLMQRSEQDDLIRYYFSYVFQTPKLIKDWNAIENIKLFMDRHFMCEADMDELAIDYCLQLNIDNIAYRPVYSLSGGELQLVSIARALAKRPKILILDEPTSNLDAEKIMLALNLIKNYVREKKAILIMVTHRIDEIRDFEQNFMIEKTRMIKI